MRYGTDAQLYTNTVATTKASSTYSCYTYIYDNWQRRNGEAMNGIRRELVSRPTPGDKLYR